MIFKDKTELDAKNFFFYLISLGAKYCYDKHFELDNNNCFYANFCERLFVDERKVPEEAILHIKELDDYFWLYLYDDYFGIKYLETLVYIHAVLSGVKEDINRYVSTKVKELKLKALNYEIENKKPLFKESRINEDDLTNTKIVKKHLNKLLKLIYPISIDDFENDLENFIYDNTFYFDHNNDNIDFKWNYYLDNEPYITCSYESEDTKKNLMVNAIVSYNYEDRGGVESLSYKLVDNEEIISYYPPSGYSDNKIEFNLTKGLIKRTNTKFHEAKEEDYKEIIRIIDEIVKSLLNRLPYLKRKEEKGIKKYVKTKRN